MRLSAKAYKSSHHKASHDVTMSEDKAIFSASDVIHFIAKNEDITFESMKLPERLLVTYHKHTYETAKKLVSGNSIDWWLKWTDQPFCVGQFSGVRIAVGRFMVGAPAAAMTLELAIACGVRVIFEVGLSGGLQPFLQPGSIVIATTAMRDEGTSFHYLPPEVNVESSTTLRDCLIKHLNQRKIKHSVGPVWSTDGVYRETRNKLQRFKSRGCLAVNMETSAIFAVAEFRGVEAASAQVISDILTEAEWHPHFLSHQSVRENAKILLQAVLLVLSKS